MKHLREIANEPVYAVVKETASIKRMVAARELRVVNLTPPPGKGEVAVRVTALGRAKLTPNPEPAQSD